ncbi:MAG TPA: hypothetical protein VNB90_10715 [Cytophagaceae bacterium]|nr:hypothetical protein [Cytophagaceae bacterium]
MKKPLLLCCLLLVALSSSFAQNCVTVKKGLRKGQTYTAECDSMIVLDKKTYEGYYNKIYYDEAIISSQDKLDSLMRADSKAKDELIRNLDKKIEIQATAIQEYRSKIDTLYAISNKSFDLNDKAIKALQKEKTKNKLAKAGLITAGGVCLFLVGIIAAGAF